MPSLFRLLFGAVLAMLALTACSRASQSPVPSGEKTPGQNAGPPGPGDWIVQQVSADPQSLNPITDTDAIGAVITGQIFEGLLQMNNYTLQLDPCLAASYEIAPDQLTYTFHLRHDVTWQDGAPFTAADVKYTYDRIQDPKVDDAPIRSYFTTIKSCTVLDPYTVRFTSSERYFKTLEMIGTMAIVPQHILEKEGDFNSAPFNRAPIGTGAYKFLRWGHRHAGGAGTE